jgi:hypothetical protein
VVSLGTSVGTCLFSYTYMFVPGAFFILYCACVGKDNSIRVFKDCSDSFYFFVAVGKGARFCFVVLRVSTCFVFVVGGFN